MYASLNVMSAKRQIAAAVESLPEDVTMEEAVARILQVVRMRKAQRQSEPDAWDVLDELTGSIEAPADWASEHDHYLYGTPKRNRDGSAA